MGRAAVCRIDGVSAREPVTPYNFCSDIALDRADTVNLKFIETFIWVARLRSFSLAAEKLFTTQASVSSRIAALERELDVRLLVRNSKAVRLTAEGVRILAQAEVVSESVERLRTLLHHEDEATGLVRVGVMDTVAHTWFIDLISELTRRFPKIEVALTVDTALNLTTQLRNGQLDVAFHTDLVRDQAIASEPLLEHPMAWIAAPGHMPALTGATPIRIVTFSRHSRPYQEVAQLLKAHQARSDDGHSGILDAGERDLGQPHADGPGLGLGSRDSGALNLEGANLSGVNSVAAMVKLLLSGFGIGVLPPALVDEQLARGELQIFDAGLPLPPSLPVTASWRTDVGFGATQRILDLAHDTIDAYAARVGPSRAVTAKG